MSNKGKYIDRNPNIRVAGKIEESVETVGDSLKIFSPAEAAFTIMNAECKKQKKMDENKCLGYSQFLPTETLKDLLSPELKKSRFVAFKEKFSEDMFFKTAELGQALALQSKPQEFTNENFTYGLKTNMSEKAYDLIFPNKTPHEVKREFLRWHDKYLISHKDYLPSERVKRNYNDNFNPHATFGSSYNVDQTGHKLKKCLQHCDRMVFINMAQKKFLDRTEGQLGKKIDRYNLNLNPYQTFGIQTQKKYGFDVRALIENVDPSAKQIEIIEAISHIHKLRRILFNRSDFHMYDFKTMLNKYEGKNIGFITLKSIMKIFRSLQIPANEQKIRVAVSHFEMLNESRTADLVSIDEFWKIINIQYPLPRKLNMPNLNKDEYKQTSYRLLCSDREKPIVAVPQKITSKLNDDPTTTGDLIAPDIPLQYGLCPNDFKVLRSKEELERIFIRILPENFNQVWQFACSKIHDEASCKMSVNAFRVFMDEFNNQNLK